MAARFNLEKADERHERPRYALSGLPPGVEVIPECEVIFDDDFPEELKSQENVAGKDTDKPNETKTEVSATQVTTSQEKTCIACSR